MYQVPRINPNILRGKKQCEATKVKIDKLDFIKFYKRFTKVYQQSEKMTHKLGENIWELSIW